MSVDAPFVGREAELDALLAAYDAARTGRATAVLVSGDAGVGKTSVLEELAGRAAAAGARVLLGHCVDLGAAGLPYLAVVEALSGVLDGPDSGGSGTGSGSGADSGAPRGDAPGRRPAIGPPVRAPERPGLRALLGRGARTTARGLADDGIGDAGDAGRLQLFDGVAALLAELARSQPVVLVIEDLHWADPSTRDLLRYLVGRLRDQRLLVVASYRSDDLHRAHPARRLITELSRLPHVSRVEVRPFAPAELHRFLDAIAGRAVPEQTVRRILARSEGNAFFAAELLAAGDQPGVPEELAEVLLARLDRLSEPARTVARVAAVGGRRVDDTLLESVVGLPRVELDDALREVVERQVLRAEGERYVFRHALVQEAVYGDLLPGERRRWHAAYAAALRSDAGTEPGALAELAHHSVAAHDLPGALTALVAAATEVAELHAPREALDLLDQALELYDTVPDAGELVGASAAALHLRAAALANRCGLVDRAVALAEAALALAHEEGSPALVAKCHQRLAFHLIAADREDEAVEHATAAVEGLPADASSAARAWALAGYARALMISERGDPVPPAREALSLAGSLGLREVEADALATLAVSDVAHEGETGRSDERLVEALDAARAAGDVLTELRATINLGFRRFDAGDVHGALAVLDPGVARAAAAGLSWSPFGVEVRYLRRYARYIAGLWELRSDADPDHAPADAAARLSVASLGVLVFRGDPAASDTIDRLSERRLSTYGARVLLDGFRAEHLRLRGDAEGAADEARTAIARLGTRQAGAGLVAVWLGAVEIGALADLASRPAALRAPDQLADLASRADDRLGAVRVVVERARKASPRSEGPPGPEALAWLARAEAEATRLPGVVSAAADQVAAWRSAWEAYGYGHLHERARAAAGLAGALLATESRGSAAWDEAAALLDAAAETADTLGARPLADQVAASRRRAGLARATPTAHQAARVPVLTPREVAVLQLAAQGRTNREIGGELYISDKTVSVHMSNAMAKLGASGRTEAVALAHRQGLLPLEPTGRA